MQIKVKVSTIFHCSLESAFKTPMLVDVAKVHTGFGVMPRVTHCTEGENWGQPGSSKKIFVAKSLTQKGGYASLDRVLERRENQYWKIEVSDFQAWMLGFYKFVGEWQTTPQAPDRILIDYTYTLHAHQPWLYPLQWLFAHTFWKTYQKRVMENIRQLIVHQEPLIYP